MSFLIGLALKFGIPARFAKAAVIAALIIALLAALGTAKCAYDHSIIKAHDADQQLQIERDKAAQTDRERQADTNLQNQREADQAAAGERQQEIDNATRDIPDAVPGPRQRARVCIELRRQAKAAGRPEPAC